MSVSYSEILKLNKELGGKLSSSTYQVTVLSNCTVSLVKEILEYSLRLEGINALVTTGDYDNIIQDTLKYKDSNLIIIFWELCNIMDGLHHKIELFNEEQIGELFEKVKSEIDLALENLSHSSLVLMNKFTALPFYNSNLHINNLERLAVQLNDYLKNKKWENVIVVDVDKVVASLGREKSIDMRYYYSSKALYTVDFFKDYAEHVKPLIMAVSGKSRKALIFDCDNTLWKGILGEDGFENIEMSAMTKDGSIFSEVQNIAKALYKRGILIGLCTKNNEKDVEEVIKSHPDMQLRDEHISVKRVNWFDKSRNLIEIAQELNIGLDSIVFVDDSSFEVGFIQKLLPDVKVLQVPERLSDYPKMLRENTGLFLDMSLTDEDKNKTEIYKVQKKRENAKGEFSSIEDYLVSLKLKMTIFEDDETLIPRISQMSQKTNQFNLTTKRYSEMDIRGFIQDDATKVYAFALLDKFGDSGVTGVGVIHFDSKNRTGNIDTFLMSCRIIGRNVEYVFMDYLINAMMENKVEKVNAIYIKTLKNGLTRDFYEQCSFTLKEATDSRKNYVLDISQYRSRQINYIEVVNGKKNNKDFVKCA
ncbi:MAG TPA: hypothetical protein DD723_09470 [Candidatus Omnitrophica bacterium]|nr:MAG: hypothetical protein A2Y04_02340 [Omnitrophica WOR_2 bacterium GWC2_45_7]HBR15746.1 hypothetical protein [Candidatus Omnitrophota bacterium]